MKQYGEWYYLYRICNFDVEKLEGRLFIYGGEKLITDSFVFNSRLYMLLQKQ